MPVSANSFRRDPSTISKYVGGSFISRITDHGDYAPLRIGKDVWSKHEIAKDLGLTHTTACSLVSAFCKREGIQDTAHLYKQTSPHSLAESRLGVTSLYVMFAAFVAKGLDIANWYAAGEKKAVVTFTTYKHKERQIRQAERSVERRRGRTKRPRGAEGTVSAYLNGRSA